MSLCMVSSKITVPNTNSNNYTINKKLLNAATAVIAVVIVVNIVLRRQFVFDHYIRMFHCFDIFMLPTKCDISRNSGVKTHIG